MRIRGLFTICISSVGLLAIATSAFIAWQEWTRETLVEDAKARVEMLDALARQNEKLALVRGGYGQVLLTDIGQQEKGLKDAAAAIGENDEARAKRDAALQRLPASLRTNIGAEIAAADERLKSARAYADREGAKPLPERESGANDKFKSEISTIIKTFTAQMNFLEKEIMHLEATLGMATQVVALSMELRELAGMRSFWLSQYAASRKRLSPEVVVQIYELNGRIAQAWERVKRAVEQSESAGLLVDALAKAQKNFIEEGSVKYAAMFAAARDGAEPPIPLDVWRPWTVGALQTILGVRDAAVAQALADANAIAASARLRAAVAIGFLAVIVAVALGAGSYFSRRVVTPLCCLAATIEQIAGGSLDVDITGAGRQDEIGDISRAVEVLRNNSREMERLRSEQSAMAERVELERRAAMAAVADKFEQSVSSVIDAVGGAAERLESNARSMAESATSATQLSQTAASLSSETSENVQAVAAATEELSASVTEIGRQASQSSAAAGRAVEQADAASAKIDQLQQAAGKIDEVLELIRDVAGQTNLLALNATIEAARAGEAGKGFAVVASEVKKLADQTARATADISQQIDGVRRATVEAIEAIQLIGQTIAGMSNVSISIAGAVEEQSAATKEIAQNISAASGRTTEVSNQISGVSRTATTTGDAATHVFDAAKQLTSHSTTLKSSVAGFLESIRAA